MSLRSDIQKAFVESTLSEEDKGKIPQLAEDLAIAISKWVTQQTFTITEMKASLEVEDLALTGPLFSNVLPAVTVWTTSGGPGAVAQGTKGAMLPPLSLKKRGGQGGALIATGHAYVGRPAGKVPGADTTEELNDFTKVKLDPDKLVNVT